MNGSRFAVPSFKEYVECYNPFPEEPENLDAVRSRCLKVNNNLIEEQIREYLRSQGIPDPNQIEWNSIPFAGGWGISTPCFPLAAQEARSGKKVNVPQRAQEIASGLAEHLGMPDGFNRVEAVKGYLNLYFSSANTPNASLTRFCRADRILVEIHRWVKR